MRGALHLVELLLLVAGCQGQSSESGSGASNFAAGAVCDGVNYGLPSSELLRGKHLLVFEAPWRPFAFKDASLPAGWGGLNVDLLDTVSKRLGFTYTIQEMIPLPGEQTWTPMMNRSLLHCDLLMSYWTLTGERLNFPDIIMMKGHIDYSNVLVGRVEQAPESSFADSLTSFLKPFKYELWGCLIAMVLFSGMVDYISERGTTNSGSFGASLSVLRLEPHFVLCCAVSPLNFC